MSTKSVSALLACLLVAIGPLVSSPAVAETAVQCDPPLAANSPTCGDAFYFRGTGGVSPE